MGSGMSDETSAETWPDPPVMTVRTWSGMDMVRTGFGGILYFRSRDSVAGRHRWEIVGCPSPFNSGKDKGL